MSIEPSENVQGILAHKRLVASHLLRVSSELNRRAIVHDDSKFSPEEFEAFEQATPLLKTLTYGTDEYKAALASIKPALEHHYVVNDHHPEFFGEGINDMNLIQLIEMVCDWMAAVQRVKDGDIHKSLDINATRFRIPPTLLGILRNTVEHLTEETHE